MLTFVQQLLYFCTAEVIEPNWRAFMTRLNAAEGKAEAESDPQDVPGAPKRTVDELMQDHVDFLATCLKECMLTNSKLLRVRLQYSILKYVLFAKIPIQINSKVTGTCILFANYTASLTRYLDAASPASDPDNVDDERVKKLFNILMQYEQHFSRHLKILLDALNYLAATETVGFLGLCARLSMAAEGGPDGRPGPGSGSENF